MIFSKSWQCWANCCLCGKIIIDLEKCLCSANPGGPSDRNFKYMLDLLDEMAEKLATINLHVLEVLQMIVSNPIEQTIVSLSQ